MPNPRVARRIHATATLARQQLRQKMVRGEYVLDALIAAIGAANGQRGPKEIRLPLARFFFPTPDQLHQHLEIEVDDDASEVIFRVVGGDADDAVLVEPDREPKDDTSDDSQDTDQAAGQRALDAARQRGRDAADR